MKPLIYVAGPISRDPFGCVAQAAEVFQPLRDLGWIPFLPQWSVIHQMVSPVEYDDWMAYDFDLLIHCSALLRLTGASPGADLEVAHAGTLGIPVYEALAAVPLALSLPQGDRVASTRSQWVRPRLPSSRRRSRLPQS